MLEYCIYSTVQYTVQSIVQSTVQSTVQSGPVRFRSDSGSSHSRFSGRLTRNSQVVSLEIPGSSHSRFPLNFLHGLSSKSSSPINLHTSKQMAGAHIYIYIYIY